MEDYIRFKLYVDKMMTGILFVFQEQDEILLL